jgi:precorrin-2 C(20)-methyltransferase
MSGRLSFVGVGPGDPELLTLKAVRVLAAADVVAYPVSNGETTLALDIAAAHLRPDAIREAVHVPMTVREAGRDLGATEAIYDEAAARVAAHLDGGRDVAYLCEGDPLFYGTAIYMLGRLGDRRVDVVPGVTSIAAASAAIPTPLVARSESLTVLAGIVPDDMLKARLGAGGAFAILKLGRHYDRVRAVLDEAGLAGCAWYVERASAHDQRIVRVAALEAGEKPYFSLIIVPSLGDVP